MRFRFASLALLTLAVALISRQAPAAEKAVKPALVVRIASVDTLVADIKYLVEIVGKDEEAKQIEGFLKGFTGPNGIEGLDTTKPIGIYGKLSADITSSEGVLLLPVTKPKDLLDYMANKGIKPEEQKNGLYKLDLDGVPVPIYFRFANGYAYITAANGDALAKDKLLLPAVVFAATPATTLSVTVHLDEVPASLKKEFLAQAELKFEEAKKEEKPGETKVENAFRLAATDEMFALLKSITNDGGPVSLIAEINRAKEQIVLSARFAGTEDSILAGRINRLSQGKSLAPALLGTDSAFYLAGAVSLPDSIRKVLAPVFEEGYKKGLKSEKKETKELAAQFYKALSPTIQAGELDAAIDLRGPTTSGKYNMVIGAKVQDGLNLEKTIKAIVNKSAPEERAKITLDIDKVGSTNIHKVDIGEEADAEFKRLFGPGLVYFAIRDDAMFVTVGENSLSNLKGALVVEPKPGPLARLEISTARLSNILAKEQKSAPALAKETFKLPGSDRISVVLEGGKEFTLRASMKVQVLAFFFKLEEAKNKGDVPNKKGLE